MRTRLVDPTRREQRRQKRYPVELRITPELLDELGQAYAPTTPGPGSSDDDPTGRPAPSAVELDDDLLLGLASDLWRALRKTGTSEDAENRRQQQTARHLESLRDRLGHLGIAIQNHEGLVVDAGTMLDVVAWEPRTDVAPDVVLETVTPSVYRHERLLQIGQVVVARAGEEAQNET